MDLGLNTESDYFSTYNVIINCGNTGFRLIDPIIGELHGNWLLIGADFETVIDSGLALPRGIDIYNKFLLVSDYSTGDIHIYDLEPTNQFQLIHKLGTDIIDDLMSIKVGPDGTIWLVSPNANELYQILPPMNGDFNGDHSITLNDFISLLSHIINTNSMSEEYLFLADIDYNNTIDIFDLVLLLDSIN